MQWMLVFETIFSFQRIWVVRIGKKYHNEKQSVNNQIYVKTDKF